MSEIKSTERARENELKEDNQVLYWIDQLKNTIMRFINRHSIECIHWKLTIDLIELHRDLRLYYQKLNSGVSKQQVEMFFKTNYVKKDLEKGVISE